jgi:hypothetical protein
MGARLMTTATPGANNVVMIKVGDHQVWVDRRTRRVTFGMVTNTAPWLTEREWDLVKGLVTDVLRTNPTTEETTT